MRLTVIAVNNEPSNAFILVEDRDAPRNKWGDYPKSALTVPNPDDFKVGEVVDLVVRKRQ